MTDHMESALGLMEARAVDQGGYLAFMVLSGSRAFGTNHADSDWDYKGVYIAGLPQVLSLAGVPKTFSASDPDVTVYELHHFCKLAAAANPTILEMLWSPEGYMSDDNEAVYELFDHREYFLSKRTYNTYRGFAQSQRKKGMASRKARMHCVRLLWAGAKALRDGEIPVRLNKHTVEMLGMLADQPPESFLNTITALESQLSDALLESTLPDEPNIAGINELITNCRTKGGLIAS